MSTSVVYPAKSAPAIGYLKRSSNDVEIFVEDTANPNMWVKLLKKYLPSYIRLNSVTSLGGRKNVLDACKKDQAIDDRKKLYIIDGDLDLIQGKRKPNLKHLYRLRAYCVENYLFDEQSILDIATNFDGGIDRESAQRKLEYSSWFADNDKLIKPLFISYAASEFLLKKKIKTVSFSITRLTKVHPNNDCLCPHKTGARILNVYQQTKGEIDSRKLQKCVDKFNDRIASRKVEDMVSGKDCIMPLLQARMKNLFGVNVRMDVFFNMLANKADHQYDPYLLRRLNQVCA
ncbi:MAG: DUF4435 domain-containing protein [Alphaproteobacteria bacterium]|nr:DUF4435 domain-containing protein [Alphaproteobacteria bacterium]